MRKQEINVHELVDMYRRQELQLPELQRRYVWRATRVRDLLDSLYRGYPSGSILVWETDGEVPTRASAIEQEKSRFSRLEDADYEGHSLRMLQTDLGCPEPTDRSAIRARGPRATGQRPAQSDCIGGTALREQLSAAGYSFGETRAGLGSGAYGARWSSKIARRRPAACVQRFAGRVDRLLSCSRLQGGSVFGGEEPFMVARSDILANDAKLAELVRRLVNAFQPERVYLFGSRARDEADASSDYDLLMVLPKLETILYGGTMASVPQCAISVPLV